LEDNNLINTDLAKHLPSRLSKRYESRYRQRIYILAVLLIVSMYLYLSNGWFFWVLGRELDSKRYVKTNNTQ